MVHIRYQAPDPNDPGGTHKTTVVVKQMSDPHERKKFLKDLKARAMLIDFKGQINKIIAKMSGHHVALAVSLRDYVDIMLEKQTKGVYDCSFVRKQKDLEAVVDEWALGTFRFDLNDEYHRAFIEMLKRYIYSRFHENPDDLFAPCHLAKHKGKRYKTYNTKRAPLWIANIDPATGIGKPFKDTHRANRALTIRAGGLQFIIVAPLCHDALSSMINMWYKWRAVIQEVKLIDQYENVMKSIDDPRKRFAETMNEGLTKVFYDHQSLRGEVYHRLMDFYLEQMGRRPKPEPAESHRRHEFRSVDANAFEKAIGLDQNWSAIDSDLRRQIPETPSGQKPDMRGRKVWLKFSTHFEQILERISQLRSQGVDLGHLDPQTIASYLKGREDISEEERKTLSKLRDVLKDPMVFNDVNERGLANAKVPFTAEEILERICVKVYIMIHVMMRVMALTNEGSVIRYMAGYGYLSISSAFGLFSQPDGVFRMREPDTNGKKLKDYKFHFLPMEFKTSLRGKTLLDYGQISMYAFWQRCIDLARGAGSRNKNYLPCKHGMKVRLNYPGELVFEFLSLEEKKIKGCVEDVIAERLRKLPDDEGERRRELAAKAEAAKARESAAASTAQLPELPEKNYHHGLNENGNGYVIKELGVEFFYDEAEKMWEYLYKPDGQLEADKYREGANGGWHMFNLSKMVKRHKKNPWRNREKNNIPKNVLEASRFRKHAKLPENPPTPSNPQSNQQP